jgi:hypothetical protein
MGRGTWRSNGVEVCITDAAGTTAWSDTATIVVH